MNQTDYELLFAVWIVGNFIVLFFAHILIMPVLLHRLKKHDRMAHLALNVAWFYIFLNFASARMFFFLMKEKYLNYPEDLHRLGKILKYTWSYPLLFSSIGILLLVILLAFNPAQ